MYVWSSNIKVLLEQSHIDYFSLQIELFWMSCKTPYVLRKPKILSSPFQRTLLWFLSKQSPALNNTIPCWVQGGKDYSWLPFWKITTVQHLREQINLTKWMCWGLRSIGTYGCSWEFFLPLGENSGQAFRLNLKNVTFSLPITAKSTEGCSQSHIGIQTCGYPRQKVCVFLGGRRTTEVNVSS